MLTRPLLNRRPKSRELTPLNQSTSSAADIPHFKSFNQTESSRSQPRPICCIEEQYCDDHSTKKLRLNSATTFSPDNTLVLFWQLVVLLCILIYFMELPVALTFSRSYRNRGTTGYLFEIINIPCLLIFAINILVRFRTCYYHKGILVTEPGRIARHNVKFFVLDIVALMSIAISEGEQIIDNNDGNVDNEVNPFCMLFMVCKLFDIYLIEKSINRSLQLHRRLKAIFNLTVLVFFILFLCNAYACIFFTISINYKQTVNSSPDDPYCWVDAVKAEGLFISQHDWTVQYVYSLYWASTTMLTVGYGDVVPRNRYEVMFDILAEFTSCLVFAYSVNKIWEIKTELNDKRMKYQRRTNIINRFMRDKNVMSQLRGKVNAYLVHYYTQEKFRERDEENEVIQQLAPGLREELYMDCYGFIFAEFPVFKPFSEEFFIELVYHIQELRHAEGEIIDTSSEEEHDFPLSYLNKGLVQAYVQLHTRRYVINKLLTNDLYGHYEFFTALGTSTRLRACSYCLVYILKLSHWRSIIRQFPQDSERYCEIRDNALFLRNLQPLYINCWLCDSSNHIAEDCTTASLNESKILQIKNYKQSELRQQRAHYERKKFRLVEILNRGYIQQVNRMREFIINKMDEVMRSSHGSEIVAFSERQSAKSEDMHSQRFDSCREEFEFYSPKPRVFESVRRANSQAPHRLRKPSAVYMPSQIQAAQRPIAALVVDPVPAQVIETIVNQEQQKLEIDQVCGFDCYFPMRNIESILAEQERARVQYMTRRESRRISTGHLQAPGELQTALW